MDKRTKNYLAALDFLRREVRNNFATLGKIDSSYVLWFRKFLIPLQQSEKDALCRALVARTHPGVTDSDVSARAMLQKLLATTDQIPLADSRGSIATLKEYLGQHLASFCLVPLDWYGSHCTTRATVGDVDVKVELDLGGRWTRVAFFTQAFVGNQKIDWMHSSILQWIGLAAETAWQGEALEEDISMRLAETLLAWINLQHEVLS